MNLRRASVSQGCGTAKFEDGYGSVILSDHGSGSSSGSGSHTYLQIPIHICVHICKRIHIHILKHIGTYTVEVGNTEHTFTFDTILKIGPDSL
jgi:hypothetical protein